jgi:hypothetical protein
MGPNPMMVNRGRGGQQVAGANPALFNRVARLQRHNVGAVTYAPAVAGRFMELPNVGYHYRTFAQFDLTSKSIAGPAGRFLAGGFGSNTNRFMAPLQVLRGHRYTLNVSSPIYASDGYGNYIIQLVSNRGLDPFVRVASGDVTRFRKERAAFAIVDGTANTIVTPDALVVGAHDYELRGVFMIALTLGESAAAGLIPVQDIRITPQLFFDFGDLTDLVSTPNDFTGAGGSGEFAGNFNITVDFFTVPSDSIRPDTAFVLQTRNDIQSVSGSGDQIYRPQIGGVILKTIFTIWNNTKAVDVGSRTISPSGGDAAGVVDNLRLRIQQGVTLENLLPQIHIMDERRWYSKELPDEVYVFDHLTGFGDPTLPSLRDRIASNQLTRLEYIVQWGSVTVVQTAELRNYIQQLVPLPRVM